MRLRNTWEFEGWIGKIATFMSKIGRPMAGLDVVDREPADLPRRRKQGPPVWVKTVVFDPITDQLADFAEGDRVFLRGNFHNRRGTPYAYLTKWVMTEIRRVEGDASRVINQWAFEGVIARDPTERFNRHLDKSLISVGVWQTGIRLTGGPVRVTGPIIINPVALSGEPARQLMEFRKGDPVCLSGHFMCFRPKGMTQLIIDRIYPLNKEWADRKIHSKTRKVLGLADGVLEL
jgi:hypothetical protein